MGGKKEDKKDKNDKKAKKNKLEPPTYKPQSKLIIIIILLCQVTIVLSIVSFLYLSQVIYMPSHRAYNSGFEPVPVTCQTVEYLLNKNCSWASCNEWCLTKTSGLCPQIFVTVRRNATDIVLENCSRLSTNSCPQANFDSFKKFNCNNRTECGNLAGLFNCTLGHCSNMSEQMLCHYKADGPVVDSVKENKKLTGFFECHRSKCKKVLKAFSCDRKFCPKITTTGINSLLMYEDSVYTGDCARALASNAANGTNPGYPIPLTEIWTENRTNGYLIASCTKVERVGNSLYATDCLNGTVLPEAQVPVPFVNFTTLWTMVEKSDQPLDPENRFIPMQKNLTIYPVVKLSVNLDGCVNTLRGECNAFSAFHGRDGRNHTSIARFPCFYHKNISTYVIARFDLEKTRKELLVSLVVPSVMFAVSFTSLLIIVRAVKVDGNSVLRCWLCMSSKDKEERKGEQVALNDEKAAAAHAESPVI